MSNERDVSGAWPSLDRRARIAEDIPEDEIGFRKYVVRRIDQQDAVQDLHGQWLREIRTLLLVGRAGWTAMRWVGAVAVSAWGVYAAWRGIK